MIAFSKKAEERAERRLKAILAADVVGYSRLMGADEEDTLARLKAVRAEIVDPAIIKHNGRIVHTAGDGLLVEFASVVDALRCAIEWQGGMSQRNADDLADVRIEWRIGVNSGDIIIDDDDIHGDGVNVAARLEGLAEPGGICVSRGVRDQVRDKLGIDFADLGEQLVKNIARPLHVYRVLAKEKPLDASEEYQKFCSRAGLTGWWPTESDEEPWKDLIEEIQQGNSNFICILGAIGINTFDGPESHLFEALSRFHGSIRVVLCHRDNASLPHRAESIGMSSEDYSSAIESSVSRLRQLRQKDQNVRARYYRHGPSPWKMVITSQTMLVQFYPPGGGRVEASSMVRFGVTKGGGGFYHYFLQEFERIWESAQRGDSKRNNPRTGEKIPFPGSLDDLRDRGGLKGTDVANIASVSPATVSRWTSGKAFPQPKTRLLISDLCYVVDRLAEFYSPDETRIWLYSKHPLLNGERAIDLIHEERTAEVLRVIEGLDESTYT